MSADPFEMSDAAYVLGALSEQDRAAFESHLHTCAACTMRVSELRDMPRLLALAPESAFGAAEVDSPSGTSALNSRAHRVATTFDDSAGPAAGSMPELLPRLLRQVARERGRRRFATVTSLVLAAACIIAVFTVVLVNRGDGNPYQAPRRAAVMANLVDVPIRAQAEVITTDSWAQVDMWCTYNATAHPGGNYQLVARSRAGETLQLGTWPGVPGQTAVLRVPTQWHTDDIASIEILGFNGKTLSRLTL